jgi:hypothetical protein
MIKSKLKSKESFSIDEIEQKTLNKQQSLANIINCNLVGGLSRNHNNTTAANVLAP